VRLVYVIDSPVHRGAVASSLAVLAALYPSHGIEVEVGCLHDRPGLSETPAGAGATMPSLVQPGGHQVAVEIKRDGPVP